VSNAHPKYLQENTLKRLILLSLLLASASANAVQYNLFALDSLSATGDSSAYGLNESGQVVGSSYNSATDLTEAVIWNNGVVQSFGIEGVARAINNSGTAVGETGEFAASNNLYGYGSAYSWNGGTVTTLSTLGGTNAGAFDINDAGDIVGSSKTTSDALLQSHGVRWSGESTTDLGTVSSPTGYSRANAINQNGEIVGRASVVDFSGDLKSNKYQTYWDSSNNLTQTTGPYSYSNGADINNAGLIVGNSMDANKLQRATVWDGGSIYQLGTLGGDKSYLNALNEFGVMVGRAQDVNNVFHAVVSYDGVTLINLESLIDLESAGFVSLDAAYDINENGDIVGIGTLTNGYQGAFTISAVPVPAAVWLFASALGVLGWSRRKQH
jgi:probable HAF family extracellular repeat protein